MHRPVQYWSVLFRSLFSTFHLMIWWWHFHFIVSYRKVKIEDRCLFGRVFSLYINANLTPPLRFVGTLNWQETWVNKSYSLKVMMHCSSSKGIIFSGVHQVWVYFLQASPSRWATILGVPWERFKFLRFQLDKCQGYIPQDLHSFLLECLGEAVGSDGVQQNFYTIVNLANRCLSTWLEQGVCSECSSTDGLSIGMILLLVMDHKES